jgi:hypothetical protein
MQSSGYLTHYRADPGALEKGMATIAMLLCWGL